jgi:hypothetical protein
VLGAEPERRFEEFVHSCSFFFPQSTDCLYAHIYLFGLDQDCNMYHYH